jgi:zinc protease
MLGRPLLATAVAFAALLPASAALTAGASKGVTLALPSIETFTLANGLQVAVLPIDGAPVAAVHVWYHVGSKDEAPTRRGSAHMFEHLMFRGSDHVAPEEHARSINRVGGYANAQTEEDATHYVNLVPAAYVDFTLQLEAERMRGLVFRKESIDVERENVKEEIRRADNSPVARGFERFLEIAYTTHPYAWTPGGAIADLDATTPAELEAFYDTYYQPNNAMVVVVGAATAASVKASAEKWFGKLPAGAAMPRPADAKPEPAQTAARREVVEPSQIGLILAGYKLPAAKHADTYALQLATIILGGGESARLQRRVQTVDPKTKTSLGLQAGVETRLLEHPGILIALGAFASPDEAQPLEAAIAEEIALLGSKGPTADELRMAKNQVQSFFVFGLENVDGLAAQIGRSWILTGNPSQWVADLAEFEKITAADVQRVVKSYLAPSRATVVIIPPAARPVAPAAAPAATAPAPATPVAPKTGGAS